MKRLSFTSIRTRITLWFLLLALLPLLVALLITYFQRVEVIESSTFDKLTAIRDLKVQQLEEWLNERSGDLQVLSNDSEIRGLEYIFEKDSPSVRDLTELETASQLLERYKSNYFDYSELFIVDATTGVVEVSTSPGFIGTSKISDPYITVPLETGEVFFKGIYYSSSTDQPELTISIPIRSMLNEHQFSGVLVARIDLRGSLYAMLLNRVGLGDTGETLIVNKDGLALNELRWYDDAPLNLVISAEPAANAARGESGIVLTTDYRGEDILAAYTHIPITGWGFVCKQDVKELRAPIREMIWKFMILFILSGIIIVAVAVSVSNSISKPIIEMSRISKNVAKGDFSEKYMTDSKDELGSLARGFSVMLDAVSSRMKIQNGVTDISETMIGQSSPQDFGRDLLIQMMELTEASMGTFYILNEAMGQFEHFTSVGANKSLLKPFNAENAEGEFGNALSKKTIYYLRSIPADTIFKFRTSAGDAIPREIITIPVVVEDKVIALISLVNIHKFSEECYEILSQSWMGINTSYSNILAGEKTRLLAEKLSIINQQIESQSEELQEQSEELQEQAEELQAKNIELEAQNIQVETANKLKSEFLSNMSHELRTPLNSILALSRVLILRSKSKLDDEEINYLNIVERNGKQLLNLINDILDLSKIEAGKMDVICKEVSLVSILTMIVETQEPIADKKGIAIGFEVPEDLPFVETDEMKLHHALTNIIANAVKFTQKGRVEIRVTGDPENVHIRISDSGIGIAKESLGTIFEEFRQVDGSSSREYEGTGLGLAIADKMIKVLGGRIHVESKLGVGSIFTVTLPLHCGEDSITPGSNYFNPKKNYEVNIDHTEKRILLVEDTEAVVIQVKSVLDSNGFLVDVASGGKQALDYLNSTIPDAIILDLMMPEVDGFKVLDNIRSKEKLRDIPVLILSAKDLQSREIEKLHLMHVQQIIQKGDVNRNELLSKVHALLGSMPKLEKESSASDLPGILVVEDNRDNMIVLNAILKDKYKIWSAYNGEDGFLMARDYLPDLILLDMSLPGMDGLNVIQNLLQDSVTSEIPVIAVSARAMSEDVESSLKAGCKDFVAKPIDADELLSKISKWMNQD